MYRTIDAALWSDPKIKKLSPEGKLFFLYLVTNSHTHVSGFYYLPLELAQIETGLRMKDVNTLCHTLFQSGLCGFDSERSLVWVRNMMRYQGRGDKACQSAAHHVLEDLHRSPLIRDFLKEYPEVAAKLPVEFVESLIPHTIGYPAQDGGATPDSLFPIPDSLILNPKQEQESPAAPDTVFSYTPDFERSFWNPYPKKVGKGKAFAVWNRISPTAELREKINTSVLNHSASAQWMKKNGEYIPNPATFLSERRWEDGPVSILDDPNEYRPGRMGAIPKAVC